MDELFGLTGKVAVVTGAAGGIGLGIARVLANAGATVALADKDHAEAMRQAADIAAAGHDALAVAVDLADENSVVAACAQIVGTIGVPWLLVNNAALQDRELLLEATTSEWDKIHTVNARGAFLMTRESARAMVASGRGGRIVNIASNALRGGLIKGLVSYASSKGALAALSLATAFELAEHSITVNTILPGRSSRPVLSTPKDQSVMARPRVRRLSDTRSRTRSVLPSCFSPLPRRAPSRIKCLRSMADFRSANCNEDD